MEEKRCPQCQRVHAIEVFGFRSGGKYRHSWCLPCRRASRPRYGTGKSERFASKKALLHDGQKLCIGCQVLLPLDKFRATHGGKYYTSRCRTCAQAWQTAWHRTAAGRAKTKAALRRRLATDPMLSDRLRAIRRADYHRHRAARLATSAANPRRHWHARNTRLKQQYGIDQRQFDVLARAQGGCCAICGGAPTSRRPTLVVDHDHTTGAIRALLCAHCNTGLGNFRDSVERLTAAMRYLQRTDRVERLPIEDRTNDGQHNKLKRHFGIGRRQYEALCAQQEGRCGLCQQVPQQRRRLAVDHDHATETIRGILCGTCNAGLGHFGDNIARLQAAVQYLQRFQEQAA